MSEEPLVSAEEVASVLSPGDDAAQEAQDAPQDSSAYSLRTPLAITRDAEPVARKRVELFCEGLARELGRELETELELQVDGFKQQQVRSALEGLPGPVWVLTFDVDRNGIALLLEPSCALTLVELALGGTGNSQAAGRAPTPLESRVIAKLARTLVEPLARACELPIVSGDFRISEVPDSIASPGETVGAALLKVKINEDERAGMLLVSAGLLRDEDEDDAELVGPPGPIADRLEQVEITGRPVLAGGMVTLRDLTELEPGKVLRLEASVEDTLELRASGLPLFEGHVRKNGESGSVFEAVRRRGSPCTVPAVRNDSPAVAATANEENP